MRSPETRSRSGARSRRRGTSKSIDECGSRCVINAAMAGTVGRVSPALRRNYGEHEVRLPVTSGVHRVLRADVVVGMIMPVDRSADAVARLDVEPYAVAFAEHHGGRPDLDVTFDGVVRLEPQPLVVRVIRPIGKRALGIELA